MAAVRAPTYTASEMLSIGISSPAAQELPRRVHQNAFDMHVLTDAGKSKYEEKQNEQAQTHKDEIREKEIRDAEWQIEQTVSNETDDDMHNSEAPAQVSTQEIDMDESGIHEVNVPEEEIQKAQTERPDNDMRVCELTAAKSAPETEIAANNESIIHQLLKAVNNISLRGGSHIASNWPAPNVATRSKYSQYGPAVQETKEDEGHGTLKADAWGNGADKANDDNPETHPPHEHHETFDTHETRQLPADHEEQSKEASFDSGTLPSLASLENISDRELVLEWQRRRLQVRLDKMHNVLLAMMETLRNEMQRDDSIIDRIGHAQWQEWNDIIND